MKPITLGALAAFTLGASALAQPFTVKPGLMIKPFAGLAAGRPPLSSPKFAVIDAPGGAFGGLMYVSELGGTEVSQLLPNGFEVPFTMRRGPTQMATYGLDIDGPIANLLAPTTGLYGGPTTMAIADGGGGLNPPLLFAPPAGGWLPWLPCVANPGPAQLQFDRTPGFRFNGMMYLSDWGGDGSDGIFRITPGGAQVPFCPLPGLDPRYFTFDIRGVVGYPPMRMWVTSFNSGQVLSVNSAGVWAPYAVLAPGIEGLAFGPGDAYFGSFLYVANLTLGAVDIVLPGGGVQPFAAGFPGAAYPMFVTAGPFARYNAPTLYLADGADSVWVIFHCPADFNDDGFVDFFDYDAYVNCYEGGGCPAGKTADVNGDGFVDFFDYDDFVALYETGC